MGRLVLLLYVDTAPLIYLVEHVPQYGDLVAQRLSSTDALVVSDLSRLECRVKPMRDGNTALLDEFDRFFNESVSEVLALSREVIDRATEIRSLHGFKTPDAIHLAAAILSNCELFLTNDRRLDGFTGLRVETLTV
ncbi:MAG TPA: type II toxin-antitoxin system VapC family toxin [Candidatus Binatia bacterium]|nr:type II toxin-antitoxin system VapC family toxin [Candidatus Binatia bacterium]